MKRQKNITYRRQASGEYYIFVDGKYETYGDNYDDTMRIIEALRHQFEKEDKEV